MIFIPLVKHLMISHPVTVAKWQTLREARQLMIRHSSSFLPIEHEGSWKLLADYHLVAYLANHPATPGKERDPLLNRSLEETLDLGNSNKPLQLIPTKSISPELPVQDIPPTESFPLLVVEQGQLRGIISPFDRL
jgi:CBS domain-containing protein